MTASTAAHLKQIGTRIRQARWAAGLTQEEAAARGKITYQYFRQAERGRRNVTIEMLHRIARAVEAPVGWLVTTDPDKALQFEKAMQAQKPTAPPRGRRPKASRTR